MDIAVVIVLAVITLVWIWGVAAPLFLAKKDFSLLRGTRWDGKIPEYWIPLGCIGLTFLALIWFLVVTSVF